MVEHAKKSDPELKGGEKIQKENQKQKDEEKIVAKHIQDYQMALLKQHEDNNKHNGTIQQNHQQKQQKQHQQQQQQQMQQQQQQQQQQLQQQQQQLQQHQQQLQLKANMVTIVPKLRDFLESWVSC